MGRSTSTTAFDEKNLILCLYNVDTLNICMKEFCSEKIIFDKMTAYTCCAVYFRSLQPSPMFI